MPRKKTPKVHWPKVAYTACGRSLDYKIAEAATEKWACGDQTVLVTRDSSAVNCTVCKEQMGA